MRRVAVVGAVTFLASFAAATALYVGPVGIAAGSGPRLTTTGQSALEGVSCPSTTECFAVGYSGTTVFNDAPIADEWNGTKWVAETITPTTENPSNPLYGISCVSTSFCKAVGTTITPEESGSGYSEAWTGQKWVTATAWSTPDVIRCGLAAVDCIEKSDCWAVGSGASNGGVEVPFVNEWTISKAGAKWTEANVPTPTGASASQMLGVTCVTSADCWDVGNYTSSTGVHESLIEHLGLDAPWKVVTAPNPSGAKGSFLDAVTCVSSSDCYAVGYTETPLLAYHGLIEHWNGHTWALVTAPVEKSGSLFLNGVTCLSATSCFAVGSGPGSTTDTDGSAVVQLKGTTWKIMTTPDLKTSPNSFLSAVSCGSSTNCNAVGYGENSSFIVTSTFALHWNGLKWIGETPPG